MNNFYPRSFHGHYSPLCNYVFAATVYEVGRDEIKRNQYASKVRPAAVRVDFLKISTPVRGYDTKDTGDINLLSITNIYYKTTYRYSIRYNRKNMAAEFISQNEGG